jgi:acetyl-CoA carboxylase biotin carboxyl carrier protein
MLAGIPHNLNVDDVKSRISELSDLMTEFGLQEAELSGKDWKIGFARAKAVVQVPSGEGRPEQLLEDSEDDFEVDAAPAVKGTPVNSPMNGIFYSAPSPSAPAFVKEGETVTAGQVVGLIEAMKVFNEIVAPLSGKVLKLVAENGQLVQPGEVLLVIE